MNDLVLITSETPGKVSFENYETVKAQLQTYVEEKYSNVDYSGLGIAVAEADYNELKNIRKIIKDKQKELEKAYSAPFVVVNSMLDEIASIIEKPYKKAKDFYDAASKEQKHNDNMAYAYKAAEQYGDIGAKTVASAAFYNKKWDNASTRTKAIHDEIDSILKQSLQDVQTLQRSVGNNPTLLTRYYETLSMADVKSFNDALLQESAEADRDCLSIESDNNVLGYKVLKITATQDQMASIMDQLDLMGVQVEVIEDGMPAPMRELNTPSFSDFVAFDIETTGTTGAAGGDSEAQITEIGAVKVSNGEVIDRFDQLANPGRKIVPRIARLTHITDEMVADQPPVSEVIKQFHDFVGDNILIGHNIKSSDLRYITKAADKAGIHFDGEFLDTYLLAKRFKEKMNWDKVNLPYLSDYYGFEHKEKHRAWSDAEVNARLYYELQKLSRDVGNI